jgi:hypothetical protein
MRLSFGDQGLRLEHAGDDALRSPAMNFRLLWANGEPSQFSRSAHDPYSGEIHAVVCAADAVDDWLNGGASGFWVRSRIGSPMHASSTLTAVSFSGARALAASLLPQRL